mgnify:FL=1|tara:strand:+ start:3129 stop:4358 length:1230 start_codon:yes stop_codon:yes gene_type:complete
MKNNTLITLALFLGLIIYSCNFTIDSKHNNRWSEEKIWEWYDNQPWLVGTNFITSSSINQLEFWQEDTFDPNMIEKELKLSASIGMNTHRVFLHDLLWVQDSIGFMERIDQFLKISEKYNIKTMLVFFDDVWHPIPKLGKQPEPIPHVHNSGWVQSPGVELLTDTLSHDTLEPYVKGIINKFKDDPRILCWDLYNEPGQYNGAPRVSKDRVYEIYENIGIHLTEEDLPNYYRHGMEPENPEKRHYTLSLIKKVFKWAREVNPSQPITAGIYDYSSDWGDFEELPELEQFMINNSDVISYHDYFGLDYSLEVIKNLKKYNRPLLCTEYVAREYGNTFEGLLPVFKKNKIGGYNWGFVAGKTNTNYPWKSWDSTYTSPPEKWHHDIFYENGEPFSEEEVRFIKEMIRSENN